MDSSIKLLRIWGIDLRMHITFPLILIWGAVQFGVLNNGGASGALFGVIVTLLLFAIVVLHELGHSFAARYYGVGVRQIVLLPIGGVAQLEEIPEHPRQELVIAIAGPAVNFALALLLAAVAAVTPLRLDAQALSELLQNPGTLSATAVFLYVNAANLALGVFNLIPAFPMDGGRILRAGLATQIPYVRATSIAANIGQSIAWGLGLWGFLGGGFFLILLAIFVYIGAGQEAQAVKLRHALAGLTVADAYSPHARSVGDDAPLRAAVDLTLSTFQSDFPVCRDGTLVGVLTYQKLLDALDKRGPHVAIGEVLDVVVPVTLDSELAGVQQRMGDENLNALPVVTDDGRFAGLITSRDIGEAYRLADVRRQLAAMPASPGGV